MKKPIMVLIVLGGSGFIVRCFDIIFTENCPWWMAIEQDILSGIRGK